MTSTTIKKIYTVPHFYVQCTAWNWIKAEIDYEGTDAGIVSFHHSTN